MAEELLLERNGKPSAHLTRPLLAVAFLASFGSSMLYGYNLAVVNSPAQEGDAGESHRLVFIGGALMGFSRRCRMPTMVIVGRFITGLHSGISLSVVPMYLGEIAPKNLRGFLGLVPSIHICLGVFIAQVLGLSELLGKIWFYTNDIFKKAGIPEPLIQYTTVGTGAIEVISGMLGCFTIERVGRRPLMIGGFLFMALCCTGITVSALFQAQLSFMRYVSVGCVVGIIAGFCIGPAGVPFLITAELFKKSHRPAAYTVAGCLNWMSNFTIGFVFPFLECGSSSEDGK
ncbi:solute carrier family 2 member 15b isoform X2 [Pseudoliparis swirei]|uniref:solute carrier family 2 member 15b isoform X2 n=1 Tax=Pseudoliparis swirei TaxID=2059687 RepID=UPI0024BD7A19|nr:solute carrier family 2 member 15b isoform X2 [Pseudoliparis swirei]